MNPRRSARFWLRVGAVATAALLGVAALLSLQVAASLQRTVQGLAEGLSVLAYLPPGTSPHSAQVADLEGQLKRIDGVERVLYVSREESLERLRNDLGQDRGMLDDLGENPLPASFELRLASETLSTEQMRAIAAEARETRGIDDVHYSEEWLSRYERDFGVVGIGRWVFGFGLPSLLFVAGIALLVLPVRGSVR
jgi:cell division transport system permease protein